MIRLTINPLLFFVVCCCIGITNSLNAQEVKNYNGPLQIGKYNGMAKYTYKIVDNDTVLEGDFLVVRSNLQELLQKQDYSFQFKGSFVEGTANGPWKFQFGEFNSESQSEIIDYQYRVLVSGIQKSASGKINMGKPNGKWTILEEQIENSEIVNTLFKSVISFDNGVPQQNFSINNEDYTLIGRFLRDGLAHDEWSLFPVNGIDQSESWFFRDGLLMSIRVDDDNDHKTIQAYNDYNGKTQTINLNESYIKALEIQLSQENIEILQDKSLPRLLTQNANRYQEIDAILSSLGKSEFLPEFKVKVPYYPLNTIERNSVDSIVSFYQKAKILSETILHNSQLNLLKLSDSTTAYQYNSVLALKNQFLKPIKNVVDFDSLGIEEFAAREQLQKHLFPNGFPSKNLTIEIAIDSTTGYKAYEIPTSAFIDESKSTIENLVAISKAGLDGIMAIADEVKETLAQEKRQNELVYLEEQIIMENDSLIKFSDSLLVTDMPVLYRKPVQHIKSFANRTLNDYSKVKSAQNRLIQARKTVTCLAGLNQLVRTVEKMPKYKGTLKDTYTDRIWNPFMATLMDEDIKRRITTAYNKILEPYFLNETSALDCDKVSTLNDQINSTYLQILELRDQETKKLERKLKKEKDPSTILQMLNVQNTVKQ
ncbi:hypothetical protein JM81_0482 [Maribacter sp. MAR_2009_72]|nr:hypothetical protein JM81_0482 [Maribacter sp. MAR_2009_72]